MREGLRGHDSEDLALRLMGSADMASDDDAQAAQEELRNLLRLMLADHLKVQENLALEAMLTDPAAEQRYRELQARRKALVAAGSMGIIPG
jgi:DNA primase